IEAIETPLDFDRAQRLKPDMYAGMLKQEGSCQKPDARTSGGDGPDGQTSRHPLLGGPNFLPQGISIGENPACPFDDTLTFGGESAKSLSTVDDEDIQLA